MVEVDNVSKNFGKQQVLYDITFSLAKGEIVALLGANGAGKTTTMNIIAGILHADNGNVVIDGLTIEDNPAEYKSKIGYLPENNPLYEDMYVREYLEYVAGIYGKKERKNRVSEIIECVDLTNEYKKKIGTLSHGNKQRVGLAQALIHDPEILILDEPSTGLDPMQQSKINNLVQELGKTKAVLFSSHRLDDVSLIATRYLILREGRLLMDSPAGDVESIKEHFFQFNENNS